MQSLKSLHPHKRKFRIAAMKASQAVAASDQAVNAIEREAELGCTTRDGGMGVTVALWEGEMKKSVQQRRE